MPWFVQREPIMFEGRRFVWNGPTVVLPPREVKPVAVLHGITLFAESEQAGSVGILLVPVSPGCAFQPYYYFTSPRRPGAP